MCVKSGKSEYLVLLKSLAFDKKKLRKLMWVMTKMWLEPADKIDLAQNGSQIFRKMFTFELPFSFSWHSAVVIITPE